MLEPWHEFYALIGTAAAALVALLFVAASILANVFTAESADGTRTFMSPVVFHYANILFLSLIALVPDQTPAIFSLVVAVAALGSLAYSIFVAVRVFRHAISDLPDRLAYGLAPVAAYSAGLVAAWLVFHRSEAGLNVLAGAALLLLVVNMRNAWDLMLSLARRNALHRQNAEGAAAKQPPTP